MFEVKNKFNKEIEALPGLLAQANLEPARQQVVKDKILKAISNEHAKAGAPIALSWTEKYDRVLRYAVSVLLGLSLVGGTSFAASGSALPGDFLYPIKLAKEKVQLSLAGSAESKALLKARFAANRLTELKDLSGEDLDASKIEGEQQNGASLNGQVFINSTTTASGTPDASGNGNIKSRAKKEAQAEVKDALDGLKLLKNKFKLEGDDRAAAGVSGDILNLQREAASANIGIESEDNGHGGDDIKINQTGSLQASSTTQIQIQGDDKSGSDGSGDGNFRSDTNTQLNSGEGLEINK